jgi:hypothetical protein
MAHPDFEKAKAKYEEAHEQQDRKREGQRRRAAVQQTTRSRDAHR